MYGNLLVCVDESEESERAVEAARDLARLSGGMVRMIHVIERVAAPIRGGGLFDAETSEAAERLLAKKIAVLEESGLPVSAEIRTAGVGHVAQEIVTAARECVAGAIVMGCRGHSALGALVMGSTTYKVLHLADRPVLVVP